MKKVVSVAILTVLAISAISNAYMSAKVTRLPGHFRGDGGEFTLTSVGDPIPGGVTQWQSFCLEMPEPVTIGATYKFDISTGAINGGYSGGNPDPISPETAYLYTQFLDGNLSNYNYTPGYFDRRISAGELQEAIWYLEGEADYANGQAATWVNEAFNAGWNTTGDIYVVNFYTMKQDTFFGLFDLGDPYRVEKQSMLIRVPSVVPAPGAVILASIGILITNRLRNRRRLS